MDSLIVRVFKILPASSPYMVVFLSIDTMQAPTFITAVFPNRLPSCFFTKTRVNLRNMTVYRDIKIYRNVFLKVMFRIHYTFRSVARDQATNCFHFFSATQLHIGIPISGLISIIIKCAMCRVFAQRVTYK